MIRSSVLKYFRFNGLIAALEFDFLKIYTRNKSGFNELSVCEW